MNTQDRHRNLYEDPLSVLIWWYDLAILFMMFPSNSVVVFLRADLGYRLMRPWVFGANFVILWTIGSLGGLAATFTQSADNAVANGAVLLYALAMEGLAFIHRRRGWNLVFRNPDPVHSMSRGSSYLTAILPVPEWIIQRYIEPVIVLCLAFIFYCLHWTVLGIWFFVSAICLAGIEALVLEKATNGLLDVRDDRIEAGYLRQVDQAFSGQGQTVAAGQKIGGLVTASPELARLRAERLANTSPSRGSTDDLGGTALVMGQ